MSFDNFKLRKSPSLVKTHSGVIPKIQEQTSVPEPQSVVINFYPGNPFKRTDKNIQTESELRPDLEEIGITIREYSHRREASTCTDCERQQLNLQVTPRDETSNLLRNTSNFPERPTYFSSKTSCHLENPSYHSEKALYHGKSPSPFQESRYPSEESLHLPGKSSYQSQKLSYLPEEALLGSDKPSHQLERSIHPEKYQSKESQYQSKDLQCQSEEPLYQSVELSEVTSESSMSNEKKEESRKFHGSDGKSKISAREASDLERRRLEVELKAAEEIATIRQAIIEKRLALELATIQDGEHSQALSKSQAEIKALEELAMRKQSLIETNLAQELQTLDYQRPPTVSRNNPPLSQSQPVSSPSRLSNLLTGSSSSVVKGVGMLDKKFNWDGRFNGYANAKPTNYFTQDKRYPEVRESRYQDGRDYRQWSGQDASRRQDRPADNRYFDRQEKKMENVANWPPFRPADPMYQPQYQTRMGSSRAKMAWKAAVSKIRKKIRNRSSEPWD